MTLQLSKLHKISENFFALPISFPLLPLSLSSIIYYLSLSAQFFIIISFFAFFFLFLFSIDSLLWNVSIIFNNSISDDFKLNITFLKKKNKKREEFWIEQKFFCLFLFFCFQSFCILITIHHQSKINKKKMMTQVQIGNIYLEMIQFLSIFFNLSHTEFVWSFIFLSTNKTKQTNKD